MVEDSREALSPGELAPNFALEDILSGVQIKLSSLRGRIVVLNFWSCECPWSRHYDEYFAERADEWAEDDIQLLHIKSNVNEPATDVERLAVRYGVDAPILNDENADVADTYGAETTPHVFLIDQERRIAYQGAIDDRSFRQREATVNYLDLAIDALRAHEQPEPAETPAYGCAITRVPYEEA